jgi:hypothetical protein
MGWELRSPSAPAGTPYRATASLLCEEDTAGGHLKDALEQMNDLTQAWSKAPAPEKFTVLQESPS